MQSSSQITTTNKPTSSFLQARCPSCHPTNSVRALKGKGYLTASLAAVKSRMKTFWYWLTKVVLEMVYQQALILAHLEVLATQLNSRIYLYF